MDSNGDGIGNFPEKRRDPGSFLNWLERLLRMRKEVPEIGWGAYDALQSRPEDPAVLILRYRWRNNSVVFLHNLAGDAREFCFQARTRKARKCCW